MGAWTRFLAVLSNDGERNFGTVVKVEPWQLLAGGARWWLARSARGAMTALSRSSVEFRRIVRSDGTIELNAGESPDCSHGKNRRKTRPGDTPRTRS